MLFYGLLHTRLCAKNNDLLRNHAHTTARNHCRCRLRTSETARLYLIHAAQSIRHRPPPTGGYRMVLSLLLLLYLPFSEPGRDLRPLNAWKSQLSCDAAESALPSLPKEKKDFAVPRGPAPVFAPPCMGRAPLAMGLAAAFLATFLTTFFAPFFPFGASSFLSKKPITVGVGATVGARTAREAIADGFTNPSHEATRTARTKLRSIILSFAWC